MSTKTEYITKFEDLIQTMRKEKIDISYMDLNRIQCMLSSLVVPERPDAPMKRKEKKKRVVDVW